MQSNNALDTNRLDGIVVLGVMAQAFENKYIRSFPLTQYKRAALVLGGWQESARPVRGSPSPRGRFLARWRGSRIGSGEGKGEEYT
jgi:hypothetical protein